MSKIDNQPATKIEPTQEEPIHDSNNRDLLRRGNKETTFVSPPEKLITERISNVKSPSKDEELFTALEKNDIDEFRRIVQSMDQKTVAKTMNKDGETICHMAVLQKNMMALVILYDANHGAINDIRNQKGKRVGDYIQQHGEEFIAELLKKADQFDLENTKRNHERLFEALDQGDQEYFSYLLTTMSTQQIANIRDKSGRSLPHLAIEKHNIPAFMEIRKLNESPIGGIKNTQGETVDEVIQKQDPAFIAELRATILAQTNKQNISQKALLEKAGEFLRLRAANMRKQNPDENSPELQHIKELEMVVNDVLSQGHCKGFALAWSEMFTLKMENEFQTNLTLLKDWDFREKSITPELTNMMDDFFQRVLFYYLSPDVSKLLGLADSHDNSLPKRQLESPSVFTDNKRLIFPIDLLRVWMDYIPPDTLASLIKEGNTILIGAGGHAIAIGQRNGSFYLYDSNYAGNEPDFDPTICAVKFDSLEALSKNIRHQVWENLGKKGSPTEYILTVFDTKDSKHQYPSTKFLEDQVFIHKQENTSLLDPYSKLRECIDNQVEDLAYIEKILSQMSVTELNNMSPLIMTILDNTILGSHRLKKEIIKLIFDKGGMPTLGERPSLYWAIDNNNDPDIIRMIYEKNPQQQETLPDDFKEKLNKIIHSDK